MPDETEKGDQNLQTNLQLVEHVTVKVPEFMESAVTGWFQIIEAQFTLKGISKTETKFLHLLTNLPANIVSKLPEKTFTSNNYEILKTAVLSTYEQTKPELLDKLMSNVQLSGRPSIYLQEMMTVADRIGVTETIVRHKFLENLPDTVRPVIAAQQELPLTQLGKLADNILPYFGNKNSSIMAVKEKFTRSRSPSPAASNTPNYDRVQQGLRPFSKDQRPKVCRAHIYFAEKARTCRGWCKWPSKTGCKILQSSRPSSRSSSPSSSHPN